MDVERELIKRRELLKAADEETAAWAREQGLICVFDTEGNLLVSGSAEAYLTEEGKVTAGVYYDGAAKEETAGEKLGVSVLYFIPKNLNLKEYDSNKNLQNKGIPLPLDYRVKEIGCDDDIFCIRPASEHGTIEGAFHTIHIAVGMVETLFFNKGVTPYVLNQCYFYYLAEDHSRDLEERKKKERRKRAFPKGASPAVTSADFIQNDSGDWDCEYTDQIWGKKADIYALYEGKAADEKRALADYAGQLNTHVQWIRDNREKLQKAILEYGMVDMARDWLESCGLIEEKGKTYYDLEEGEPILCPLTEPDFLKALYVGGINACCDDDEPEEILFDIFLDTAPDFFACHSIEVFVRAVKGEQGFCYEISVNGLAG